MEVESSEIFKKSAKSQRSPLILSSKQFLDPIGSLVSTLLVVSELVGSQT